MKCKLSKVLFRILLVLYIGTIAFLCFAKPDTFPAVHKSFLGIPADKAVHFLMFFPLPIIAFFALGRKNGSTLEVVGSIISVAAFSCVLAGITEIVQGTLPYRSEDINDFKADCLAIVLASIAVLIVHLIRSRKKHHK
ncbi:MAG TPA: hypothetical protein DDX33_03605 [Rikenellaceae bacterium]|nr:hypothetical protein [Rikenellaceae bacterium]